MKVLKHKLLRINHWLMSVGAIVVFLGSWTPGAIAAERVILKYRIFQNSVAVSDLTTLAETGEVSDELKPYFRLSRQEPEKVREILNQTVDVDVVTLDRVLNSFAGDFILERLNQYIYTESREADTQAMRAALVLSASKDNKVSLLEVTQNYPTQDVYIDGDRLEEAYDQLTLLRGSVENLLERLPNFLGG
ncbi:MAG: alpha/beta hydrolase [Oculatellaceae cyanobacterium Prado106]|nr:alpha/beta hydrolase [Oculatellaceae cyanobacterium Prado106]